MAACTDWFKKTAPLHTSSSSSVYRVLLFHMGGGRDYASLLQHLAPCGFDLAIFTTNLSFLTMDASSDRTNFTVSQDQQHINCEQQRAAWIRFSSQTHRNLNSPSETATAKDLECEIDLCLPADDVPSLTFPCINDALIYLSCGRDKSISGEVTTPPAFPPPNALREASNVQVLVTGSLHLVGGLLGILDPSLRCDSHTYTSEPSRSSLTNMVLNNYAHYSAPGTP